MKNPLFANRWALGIILLMSASTKWLMACDGRPTAGIDPYPYSACIGVQVTFRTTTGPTGFSHDNDYTANWYDSIARFQWSYEGGSPTVTGGSTSSTFRCTYATPGIYKIKLQVWDDEGNESNIAERYVNVVRVGDLYPEYQYGREIPDGDPNTRAWSLGLSPTGPFPYLQVWAVPEPGIDSGLLPECWTLGGCIDYPSKVIELIRSDISGVCTVTCTAGNQKKAKVYMVGVASLTPDSNACTFLMNDPADPNIGIYVTSVTASSLDIEATPTPNVGELNLPYDWNFTVDTDPAGVDVGQQLTPLIWQIDRTEPAVVTVSCYSGFSYKRAKIFVIDTNISLAPSEPNKLMPGQFINVNWSDDDGDGWTNNEVPPSATYTPDKEDPNIVGEDRDLRYCGLSVQPVTMPEGSVVLTFGSKVKVWETSTKMKPQDPANPQGPYVSSQISSGHSFPIEKFRNINGQPKGINLYLEGISGSDSFRDEEIKAYYTPGHYGEDVVKITVFEVTLSGLFNYHAKEDDDQTNFYEPSLSVYFSSNNRGLISCDDANADGNKGDNDTNCQYFANCMESPGTVKPSGVKVTGQEDCGVRFDFFRYRWGKLWWRANNDNWQLDPANNGTHWIKDCYDPPNNYLEDVSPSNRDLIYIIDGPGFASKSRSTGDYQILCANFKNMAKIWLDDNWYQCSDWYPWHSQVIIEPKNDIELTRSAMSRQKSAEGWISIPSDPNSL